MELEDALLRLGGFKPWQTAMYVMLSSAAAGLACWHMLAIVYIGKGPCLLAHAGHRLHW